MKMYRSVLLVITCIVAMTVPARGQIVETSNKTEKEIIYCHMFPLNLTHLPLHKESMILCIADKIVGTKETAKGKGNTTGEESD